MIFFKMKNSFLTGIYVWEHYDYKKNNNKIFSSQELLFFVPTCDLKKMIQTLWTYILLILNNKKNKKNSYFIHLEDSKPDSSNICRNHKNRNSKNNLKRVQIYAGNAKFPVLHE